MLRTIRLFLTMSILLSFSCSQLKEVAQFGISGALMNGMISGVVVDKETGAPIPLASIQVEGSPFRGVANESGAFKLTFIPVGRYRVIVAATGYAPLRIENVMVLQYNLPNLVVSLSPDDASMDQIILSGPVCPKCKNSPE